MNKRAAGEVGAAVGLMVLVAGLVFGIGNGSAASGPPIRALQQAGDSIQYEIGPWTPSASNVPVSYVVDARSDRWRKFGDPTPFVMDTMWFPQDTVETIASVRITATAGTQTATGAATVFRIPPRAFLTEPGAPPVRVISGIGLVFDSVSLVGILPTVRVRGQDVEMPYPCEYDADGFLTHTPCVVNPTFNFTGIGWTHTANGPLGLVCVGLVDGQRGWIEAVRQPDDSGWVTEEGALFLRDPDCGWEWESTDPSVATVRTGDRTL